MRQHPRIPDMQKARGWGVSTRGSHVDPAIIPGLLGWTKGDGSDGSIAVFIRRPLSQTLHESPFGAHAAVLWTTGWLDDI